MDEARDKYSISFGTLIYDIGHCSKKRQLGEWIIERMVYREEKPVCITKKTKTYPDNEWGCEGLDGRRKWIINPRKVKLVKVHEVPRNGFFVNTTLNSSMHVNAQNAWLGHYRRIVIPPEKLQCQRKVSNSLKYFVEVGRYGLKRTKLKYVYDKVIKDVAGRIRRQQIRSEKNSTVA